MPSLEEVLAMPEPSDVSSVPQAAPLTGYIAPFITSLISGAPKWVGERIEGMADFAPQSLGPVFHKAGQAVSGMVDPATRASIDATMATPWPWFDNRPDGQKPITTVGKIQEQFAHVETLIGDQLPMMGVSTAEATLATRIAQRLLGLPSPYAKGAGALMGIASMAFMTAAQNRRDLERVRDVNGNKLDEDIIRSENQKSSILQGMLEYSEMLGLKGIGIGAKLGGIDSAAAKAALDPVERFLGRKAVAYVAEPAQEIAQGLTAEHFVRSAIEEQKKRTPGFTPDEKTINTYGFQAGADDAVAAALLTGFFHASGSAARLAGRRVDAEQEQINAGIVGKINQFTRMQAPDGEVMKLMTRTAMEDMSKQVFESTKSDPNGDGWFRNGTIKQQLDQTLGQTGALENLSLKTHNDIFRSQGPKAASEYLADAFHLPLINDKATTPQALEAMLNYYGQKYDPATGKYTKSPNGEFLSYVDPDTGKTVLSVRDNVPANSPLFTKGDVYAVFGTGVTAKYSDVETSLLSAAQGQASQHHLDITPSMAADPRAIQQITGETDLVRVRMFQDRVKSFFDWSKATFGTEGKLLFSNVSYYQMSAQEAAASGKAAIAGTYRVGAQNTIREINGQKVPVLALYRGSRDLAFVEDFGEMLTNPETAFASGIRNDPAKRDAWTKLYGMALDVNRNFVQNAKVFLDNNHVDDVAALATPESRKTYLATKIRDLANQIRSGASYLKPARANKLINELVGSDGNGGLYATSQNHTNMEAHTVRSYNSAIVRIRDAAGLMTEVDTVKALYDMDPNVTTSLTPGARERFWKAVTLGMWGHSQYANQEEARKFALLGISPDRMQVINQAVETLVGTDIFKKLSANPYTAHGRQIEMTRLQPQSRGVNLSDDLANQTPVAPPVAPVNPPIPPSPTPTVPPPNGPPPAPSGGTPPPAPKPPRRRRKTPAPPPAPAPEAGTPPPPEPEANGNPPAPTVAKPLTKGEVSRLLNQYGYTLEEVNAMDPDYARGIKTRKPVKATIGSNDEMVTPQTNVIGGSAQTPNVDINALSQGELMKEMLSQNSPVGRLANWITLGVGKQLPTKAGEDYLYEASRDPKSIIFRAGNDPKVFAQLQDASIPDAAFYRGARDPEIVHALRSHALQLDPDTKVIRLTQENLRLAAKYFEDIRKFPVMYSYTTMGENDDGFDIGIAVQNRKKITDVWTDELIHDGPERLMQELERFNGSHGLRKEIVANIQHNGFIDPVMSGKMLERLTGLPAELWTESYVNGQNYLSQLKTTGQVGNTTWYSIKKVEGQTHSAAVQAINNILFELTRYEIANQDPDIFRQQAEQFLMDTLVNDNFRDVKAKPGVVQRNTSPLNLMSHQAMEMRALSGAYVSVNGDQGQSMVLRNQELDTLQDMLGPDRKLEKNLIRIDGQSLVINGKRRVDRDITWDNMLYADRQRISLKMFSRGLIEMGQIGGKTTGYFLRMKEMDETDSLYLRHAITNDDKAGITRFYTKLEKTLRAKYQTFYDSLHDDDKTAFVDSAGKSPFKSAEERAHALAYQLYNAQLIMNMDADTSGLENGVWVRPGLTSFVKDGKANVDTFGKRREQAGTGGRVLGDGKPIKAIAVDELFTKMQDDPILGQAVKRFAEENEITNMDELFNGLSLFMPKFAKRYEGVMGNDLSGDAQPSPDGLFGIKAHYRGDGKLIKVNWINLKQLADMGSPVFKDLYDRLKDTDVELIVFKQNGLKVGTMPTTDIWNNAATGFGDSFIKSQIDLSNIVDLRSDRFYSPLSLNTDPIATDAKNAKQQEHLMLHLKESGLRESLIAQYIGKAIPQWKAMVDELLAASRDRRLPPGKTEFTSADGKLTYKTVNGTWNVFVTKALKAVSGTGYVAPVREIPLREVSDIYLDGIWTDLFGKNVDLIRMAKAGENPFGVFTAQRTIPLLISKMEKMIEVGGERAYAQVVSAGNHPNIVDLDAPPRAGMGGRVVLPSIVASIKHSDGSDLMAESYGATQQELIDKVMTDPESYPWMFQNMDGMPLYTRTTLLADRITEHEGRWLLPGETVTFVRTPSDNLPSAPVGSMASAPGVNTAAIMVPADLLARMGADQDGDQKGIRMLNKVNGKYVFDNSLKGIENRILMSIFNDAMDPDQAHLWMQNISGPESYLSIFKESGRAARAKAEAKAGPVRLNSFTANDRIRQANILSQEDIGIVAASARFLDFAGKFGLYIGRGEERKQVIAPMDAEAAFEFKRMVASPLISLTVDDPKDPLLGYMGLNQQGISMFITSIMMDGKLMNFERKDDGSFVVSRAEREALIKKHLEFLQSDDAKLFSELAVQKRYGLFASKSYEYSHPPAKLRFSLYKNEKVDNLKGTLPIFEMLGKDRAKIEELYRINSSMINLNGIVNVAMRDIRQRSVYDTNRTLFNAERYLSPQLREEDATTLFLGEGFETNYGDVMRQILDGFKSMSAIDITADPVFRPLMVNNRGYFVTEDQFDKNMSNLKKRVIRDVITKQGELVKITPNLVYTEQAISERDGIPSMFSMLVVDSGDRVRLADEYKGQIDVDKALWGRLDKKMQDSLFSFMIEKFGLGQNVSNGTFMNFVSDDYRLWLSQQIESYMENIRKNEGLATGLVEAVLNNQKQDKTTTYDTEEEPTMLDKGMAWFKGLPIFKGKTPASSTPVFDTLPAKSGTKTMTYAGIGSRTTPPAVLQKMTAVSKKLEAQGYTLRSGGAEGADSAFEAGAKRKEIFRANDATSKTIAIAKEIHPNPKALGDYPLKLMARNTNQIFGKNLDSPVDFVLAWTPDGAQTTQERTQKTGGTGQAIDMASRKGIPVINMAQSGWEQKLEQTIGANDETVQVFKSAFPSLTRDFPGSAKDRNAFMDNLRRLMATENPELVAENRDRALKLVAAKYGMEHEGYRILASAIEKPAVEPVEATVPAVTAPYVTPVAEAVYEPARAAFENHIGAYDEMVRQIDYTLDMFGGGKNSIRNILVTESRKLSALQEQTFRTGTTMREIAKSNPYILRVAALIKEDPNIQMDPWGYQIPDDKAEYRNVAQTYRENKHQIDQIIKVANDSFHRMRETYRLMMNDLSLEGYIGYLENYVPHLWDVSSLSEGQLREKLRSFATSRAAHREEGMTFKEGALMGLRPKVIDLANLVEAYGTDVFPKATAKRMLEKIMNVTDSYGNLHVHAVAAETSMAQPKVIEQQLLNSAVNPNTQPMDVHKPAWSSLLDKFPKLIQQRAQPGEGYVWMPSPYKDYSGFWVHPESVNVMKNVLNQYSKRFDGKFMTGLAHVNTWSKYMALQASFFHWISILTGIGASLGGHQRLFAFGKDGKLMQFAWNTTDFKKWLRDNPMFETDMVESGLQYGRYLDVDGSMISQDLAKAHAYTERIGLKPATKAIEAFQWYKSKIDKHLWRNLHAQSKIYLSYKLFEHYQAKAVEQGLSVDPMQIKKAVAEYVNVTGGGMDWNNMAWATPGMRKLVHLFVFAPDWTLSNLEIARAGMAGLPGVGGIFDPKGGFSNITKRESLMRYWPALTIFSYVLPNMLQLMVNGMALGIGGGDDDKEKKKASILKSKMFAFQNEMERVKDVDITPLIKAMNKWPAIAALGFHTDPVKADEKLYMSFAKQINEVGDWLQNPMSTMLNKSSMIFKIALEQATGNNTTGRSLAFKDETILRGMFEADGQFMESRAGYIVEKFIPMSVNAIMKDKPPGFLAPIGKGMTTAKTKMQLEKILAAYADPSIWDKAKGIPDFEQHLGKLAPEVIDAALRNGVDVERQGIAALGAVKQKYNDMLFRGINTKNERMMETAAMALVRLGAGWENVVASFQQKVGKNTGSMTHADVITVHQFIARAEQVLSERNKNQH